jgi:hypothetical protein
MLKQFLWFMGGAALMLSTVAFALSPIPAFDDINGDEWYADPVYFLQERGIIEGYDDYTFRADNTVNRAEMAVMMERMYEHLDSRIISVAQSPDKVNIDLLYDVLDNMSALDLELGGFNEMILLASLGVNTTPVSILEFHQSSFFLEGEYEYDGETYSAYSQDAGGGSAYFVQIANDDDRWFGPFAEEVTAPCEDCY